MKESNKQFDDVKASLHTEALKLADELEGGGEFDWGLATICVSPNQTMKNSAIMIRRLVEELDKLKKDIALKTRDRDVFCDFTLAYEKRIEELEKLEQDFIRVIKQTNPNKPQTKPLSYEEITQCLNESMDIKGVWGQPMMELNPVNFARAIEERHGIK